MLSAAEVVLLPAPRAERLIQRNVTIEPHSRPAARCEAFSGSRALAGSCVRAQRVAGRGSFLAAAVRVYATAGTAPAVVLTREAGKNGELTQRLRDRNVEVLELPLVETGEGPDRERLATVLAEEQFDYVIITSPESAAVFIAGWQAAGRPQVNIAVVGAGTGRVFVEDGTPTLQPSFVASQANAVHLSAELPLLHNATHRVLYPASAKAGSDLQNGLAARGAFDVLRLNTYTTRPVASISDDALRLAKQARVLAIASPSAIKAWAHIAGLEATPAVACIGSTSARAAQALGLERVFWAEKPGVDGFVDSIMEALDAEAAPSAA